MCRFRCESRVDYRDDFELEELCLDRGRVPFIAKPLQHFREDDRRQANTLAIQAQIEPLGFRDGDAVEEIDPDRCVDDDQRLGLTASAHGVEIAFPLHFAA